MLRIFTFCILCFCSFLVADPWGKDADLIYWTPPCDKEARQKPSGFLRQVAEVGIGFHQNVISPADGPRSNFVPSSSQYTLDAVRKYGFGYGCLLGFDRLMRENPDPWVYPKAVSPTGIKKYNPVR